MEKTVLRTSISDNIEDIGYSTDEIDVNVTVEMEECSYKEATIKEDIARDCSSSEIEETYKKFVEHCANRKMRAKRHRKKISESDDTCTSTDTDITDVNENDVNEDLKHPIPPQENVFPSESNDVNLDAENSMYNRTIVENVGDSPTKRSKLDNEFNDDLNDEAALRNIRDSVTGEENLNTGLYKMEKTDLRISISDNIEDIGYSTDEIDVNVTVEMEEFREWYVVVKMKIMSNPIIIPYKWMTNKNKSCYWPPNDDSKMLVKMAMNRTNPKRNWAKVEVEECFGNLETYNAALNIAEIADRIYASTESIRRDPRIIEDRTIKPTCPQKMKSTLNVSATEFDNMKEGDQRKVIFDSIQVMEQNQNKMLAELQSSVVRGSDENENPFSNVIKDIPLKCLGDIKKIEETLKNDKEYRNQFKSFMKAQGGKGPKQRQRMISTVFPDKLQKHFNFCGMRNNNKVAFKNLFLWPILRDAFVESDKKHTVEEAENAAKNWLKAANKRIERARNMKRKRTIEDLINTVEEAPENDVEEI